MSRDDVIERIRVLSERLARAVCALGSEYDPIVAVGADALREELSSLSRQIC